MRIPSTIYKSPNNIDTVSTEVVGKSIDPKKVDGQREPGAKRDALETRVQVSKEARVLASESAIDVAKIERLRAQLDAGGLRIDPRAIAARIVNGE